LLPISAERNAILVPHSGQSVAGGQGRIFGTLIGALIIGVIRNGMNLTGVEAHMQSVVYGVVILVAVLVDQLKAKVK
jgi:ribose transport system permease protein